MEPAPVRQEVQDCPVCDWEVTGEPREHEAHKYIWFECPKCALKWAKLPERAK